MSMLKKALTLGVASAALATVATSHGATPEPIDIVSGPGSNTVSQQSLACMAQNIYFESNNQSKAGMIAVARVTMNRVQDIRYPNSVCEVVREGPVKESWKTRKDETLAEADRVYHPVRHKCQFSWWCDGKADDIPNPKTNLSWRLALDIAYEVLAWDKYNGIVEGSTHYHADYVRPKWRTSLTLVTKIDDHIFYRWD